MIIIYLLVGILAGCEGSNNVSDSTSASDTGSVAFNVAWNQSLDNDMDYQIRAVLCGNEPEQVDTVSVAIVNTEASVYRVGGPWDCFTGSGIIQDVPVGPDYTFLFYGHNEMGRTTYSGVELEIFVNTGVNDIGTIDANQFYARNTSPANESSSIDPDSTTRFEWEYAPGAARYELWISDSENIFSPLLTFNCDDRIFDVPAGNLDPGTTYYWTVWSVDIDGNRSWWYSNPFSFTTASATMDDNYEPNNWFDEAVDLPESMNLSAINGPGIAVLQDLDFYKIDVPYLYANLVISCTFIHNSGNIDIELYDADGNILDGSWSDFDNEYIYFGHAGGSAIYYVIIYLEDAVFGTSNTYDLKWTAQ